MRDKELQMFISEADVDRGVEERRTVGTTLLLSNLQAGTIFTLHIRLSKTERVVMVHGRELVAAMTSPWSKKTI